MKKEYHIDVWQWDPEYPEDMIGRYFPEDTNGLVGLDMVIALHDKAKIKNVNQH